MTDFNDAFSARAASALTALGAETVTYTPAGGSGSSIEAMVQRESLQSEEQDPGSGIETVYTVPVLVQLADVSAPAIGDRITFDPFAVEGASTLDWAVVAIDDAFGGIATLTCSARALVERSRPGSREET